MERILALKKYPTMPTSVEIMSKGKNMVKCVLLYSLLPRAKVKTSKLDLQ